MTTDESTEMKVTAVVPAAGRGRRMNAGVSKPYIMLGGRPILAHVLSRLNDSPQIDEIILVTDRANLEKARIEIVKRYELVKVKKIISGGLERTDSVRKAISVISSDTDIVLIHDGVRPFVAEKTIRKSIDAATEFGAAIVAVPVNSTIKSADDGMFVECTFHRDRLWEVQTPQAFKREIIEEAYQRQAISRGPATDDAVLVEHMGHKVKLVVGERENIKVTTPVDLLYAEYLLKKIGGLEQHSEKGLGLVNWN
jgi:2-C-methyl-D-erythritol 4-phosphate cytidylyltransferase